MFMKKLSYMLSLISCLLVAACTTGGDGWHSEYGDVPVSGRPSDMQSTFYYPEYDIYGNTDGLYTYTPVSDQKNVSVLLPMSGPNSSLGTGIATSVEMAFLQRNYKNVSVTFHDLTGNRNQKQDVITNVLASQPDIIIGPVFAEDARMLRDMKPDNLPVLSFTSDANAVGNGVMTMALMPMQSVEAIVREIANDRATSFVIMAPETSSGQMMAGGAVQSANLYDVPLSGLFYYTEGNSDSIKSAAEKASMFSARSAANTRAREILSDILVQETLTAEQKSSINTQLDKISKSDTIGHAPFDAVLFLGNANDSKALASFLRYYDVAARDATFYGTALWDSPELLNDLTMSGAKFAALPPQSADFAKLYETVSGGAPSRLDSFGFDAANLAIGMIHSKKTYASYLLDPSGYRGLDGLFRLRPNGTNERALQMVALGGNGETRLVRGAAKDFLTPMYGVQPNDISRPSEISLVSDGINPMDYIKIPEHLKSKYRSKTFGANMARATSAQAYDEVIILPEDDSEVFESPDFQPVSLDSIDRRLIDSIEIN